MEHIFTWFHNLLPVFGIGWYIWDRKFRLVLREKDKDESVYDAYWLRSIVIPICIEPLMELAEFATKNVYDVVVDEEFQSGRSDVWKAFDEEFASRKLRLSSSLVMLDLIDIDLRAKIDVELDSLEDCIADFYDSTVSADQHEIPNIKNSCGEAIWVLCRQITYKTLQAHASLEYKNVPKKRAHFNFSRQKLK